jgi:hypothetical protein
MSWTACATVFHPCWQPVEALQTSQSLKSVSTYKITTSNNGKPYAGFGKQFAGETFIVAEVALAQPGAPALKSSWKKYPEGTMQALWPTQSVRPITLPGLLTVCILKTCLSTQWGVRCRPSSPSQENNTVLTSMPMTVPLDHCETKSEAPNTLFSARRGTISISTQPVKRATFQAINRLTDSEIASRRQLMKQMDAEFEAMNRA